MTGGGHGVESYGGAGRSNTVRGFSNIYNAGRDPFSEKSPFDRGMYFVAGQRRRLNIIAILVSLFVPWLLFCTVFALLSFNLHYKLPALTYVSTLSLFMLVVGGSAFYAAKAMKNKFMEPGYQPSWYVFIAVTAFVAFCLALVCGDTNYERNMRPYYDLMNLAEYQDIDANARLGQEVMDAGRINFKHGTALRIDRSMGFKSHDVYCVAPIVTQNSGATILSYDFWAVGKNCCSGVAADFHCSGFSNPQNTGVIRAMRDEDRPFYRMAVQQAEATYKLTAGHPLFFEWVHDADEATDAFAHEGYYRYWLGCAAFFVLQLFLVGVCSLAFSKLIHTT